MVESAAIADSPYPLAKAIKLIQCQNMASGFPLRVKRDDWTLMPATCYAWTYIAICYVINFSFVIGMFVAYRLHHGDLNLSELMDFTGQSSLDFGVVVAANVGGLVVVVALPCTLLCRAQAISNVFRDFNSLGIRGLGNTSVRGLRVVVKVLYVAGFAIFATFGVANFIQVYHMFFKVQGWDSPLLWFLAVASVLWVNTGVSNPHMFTTTLFSMFSYGCLSEAYGELKEAATSKLNKTGKGDSRRTWAEVATMASKINALEVDMNAAFSPLILTQCGAFLSLLTLFSYASLMALFSGKTFTAYTLASAIGFSILALVFNITFYCLCYTGQSLEGHRESTREALEDCLVEARGCDDGDNMDLACRRSLGLSVSRMERPDPIAPYFAFGVNHSGYLATYATTLTYMIVLLQFKVTE